MSLFIGLMSGTSLDGVDGVLVDGEQGRLVSHLHRAFDPNWRAELLALNRAGADELHRMALAGNAVATLYADVVADLLASAKVSASAVTAIGAHGQTVRHRPGEFDGVGYTVQLLNAALLAELTGIDVVSDLRSRDVAAGGQGAPLVPAFHAEQFALPGQDVAILNLGGIANLTLLLADGTVLGFDTGPANALLDYWCERCTGAAFDRAGTWGASGRIDPQLMAALRQDAYFDMPPPKSTGRDRFNPEWLQSQLERLHGSPSNQDVQATLLELTASTVVDALRRSAPGLGRMLVCGGGALNDALMGRLSDLLHPAIVESTASVGVEPEHVEALAFAWLARAHVERRHGNLPAVTGARGGRILGALYPA